MFQRLHVEAEGGAAGDMLLGALVDLGADVAAIRRAFASFRVPGLELESRRVEVAGSWGSVAAVAVQSLAPAPEHHHTHLSDVQAMLAAADLPDAARQRALRVYRLLCQAEAEVHGGTADSVHLHEVGELDSVLDVVGIAVALHTLGEPRATCAPLPSGRGHVGSAHGRLAVPVPAVVAVARRAGLVLEPVDVEGETVTPTGAAVLAELCGRSEVAAVPRGARLGVGAGSRRFAGRANVVRIHAW
jgi:uncharacterized protein (DUF111 family)